jgi:hypothetical protein
MQKEQKLSQFAVIFGQVCMHTIGDWRRLVGQEFLVWESSTSLGRDFRDVRSQDKEPKVLPKNLQDSLNLSAHLPAEFPQVFSLGRYSFANQNQQVTDVEWPQSSPHLPSNVTR